MTRPWLLLVVAGAIVVLAVGLAVTSTDPADGAGLANGSAHPHGVDPVSAALLAIDGVVALAVVVLLLRRRPPPPS